MNGLSIVSLMDNWSIIVAIVGPIIGFMFTAMLWLRGFMNEMRAEHREDIKEMEERRKESESHWREMFMYFNSRLDNFPHNSSNHKGPKR